MVGVDGVRATSDVEVAHDVSAEIAHGCRDEACGDEYVVECDEVRRDGGVQTLVMYKSCVVKHYQARHTAWLLDRTDRTA